MLAYYLNLSFFFFKILLFFLANVVFINGNFLKIICILLFGLLIYYLRKLPKNPRFRKLSQLRFYVVNRVFIIYRLDSLLDFALNWVYIVSYTIIFFGFFLWLRFYNMGTMLDLKLVYVKIVNVITKLTAFELILNGILLLFIFLFIISIFKHLRKYYYFQIMRQHWYLWGYKSYEKFFYFARDNIVDQVYNFFSSSVTDYLTTYFALGSYKSMLNFTKDDEVLWDIFYKKHDKLLSNVQRYINFTFNKGHYCVLFLCLIFDLFFNYFILSVTFNVLPFVFIYSIWNNICRFFTRKDFNFDGFINIIFYQRVIPILPRWEGDKPKAIINGELCDISNWGPGFNEYEKNGFELG